jgi:hypothetical protein
MFGALQLIAAGAAFSSTAAQTLSAPPEIERADARDAYNAGLNAFARGAYTQAVREFTRADGLSASPNAKLMLGRCLRELDDLPQAYRVLIAIVRPPEALDPRYAQTRSAAEDELRLLRTQIGILTVYVRADAESALVHVDGQPLRPSEWNSAIPVRPGIVRLSLESAPGVIERREVELGAGQHASVVIGNAEDAGDEAEPQPIEVPAPQEPVVETPATIVGSAGSSGPNAARIASYIAGGTSALGFVAFGILGALSTTNYAKLEDACPNRNECDPKFESIAARGRTQQLLANVALVVGAATFATGAALYLLSAPAERPKPKASAKAGAVRARVAIAVTPVGVAVRGEL